MRSVKKIALTLSVGIVLLMVILLFLIRAIDKDVIGAYVSGRLTALTHQPTHILGSINWQLFPQPGIKISEIELGQINESAYHANIKSLAVRLNLTALFRGHLIFDQLFVDGFNAEIHSEAKSPSVPLEGTIAKQRDDFSIRHFLLTNGHVLIHKPHSQYELTNLQIGTSDLNFYQQAFPLQIKTNVQVFNEHQQSISHGQMLLKGELRLDHFLLENPLQHLDHITLDGQMIIQDFHLENLHIDKATATTQLKDGLLKMNPFALHLYKGEAIGDLQFNINQQKLNINETASNLDSQLFISDLLKKNLVKGKLDLSIHTDTVINEANPLAHTKAFGNFNLKDGSIEFLSIHKTMDNLFSQSNKLLNSELAKDLSVTINNNGKTHLKLLSIPYQLENGLLQTDNLVLQTNQTQMKGKANLNVHTFDVQAELSIAIFDAKGQLQELQNILGGAFPFLIQGTLLKPVLLPNMQKITPIIAQFWIKQTLDKPIKELTSSYQGLLSDL